MHHIPGTAPLRAQHRVLVDRIVSMQGAMKQSSRSEQLHVRHALTRLRDEERALRAQLHPDAVLHRAGRNI